MPDMHMSMTMSQTANEVAPDEKNLSSTVMPELEVIPESSISTADCERVCGYCLGSSVPLNVNSGLADSPIVSLRDSLPHRFFDSASLDNPFRPPISS